MKRKLLMLTALALCLALLCGCTTIATSEWMQNLFPVGDEAVAAQQTLNAMPAVDAMTTARQNFSELMNQVNHVLEFMITGEVEQSGGCTGNCASCGGCH